MTASLVATLTVLIGTLIDERLARSTGGAVVHSQKDGERPVGAGLTKYLRAWRAGRDAGDAGVWAEGRARLMTADAWSRLSRVESAPRLKVVEPAAPVSLDDAVLAELGARRVGGGK